MDSYLNYYMQFFMAEDFAHNYFITFGHRELRNNINQSALTKVFISKNMQKLKQLFDFQ